MSYLVAIFADTVSPLKVSQLTETYANADLLARRYLLAWLSARVITDE